MVSLMPFFRGVIQNPPSNFSHEDTQRYTKKKKSIQTIPNEKFLGVQNPFFKKGFGRRRQKLGVDSSKMVK
jgi:hypothetical protein